jgi:hypothetical protein
MSNDEYVFRAAGTNPEIHEHDSKFGISHSFVIGHQEFDICQLSDRLLRFTRFLVGGGTRSLAGRGGAAMILNFFLVAPNLPFQLIHNQIHGGQEVLVSLAGNEVVFVLGGDPKFHHKLLFPLVHQDLDHHYPLEEMQELLGFFLDELLGGVAHMTMLAGDFDLHRTNSFASLIRVPQF